MTRVNEYVSSWLNRPQRTRRDDLVIVVLGAALLWILGQVGGRALEALGLISFGNTLPLWAAALAGGVVLAVGILLGHRSAQLAPQTHELYTQHLRDALGDLRRLSAGELPDFSVRDYVENGIFQPAHRLLTTRGRKRGDVRFSIVHPDPDDPEVFTMSRDREPFPALGHSMEARQEFRMDIAKSFAGLAYETGRPQISNDLKKDRRWRRHPKARKGREYRSIISVPLVRRGEPDGVLNVIAVRRGAFQRVDQTYITLLASAIDVARSVVEQWEEDDTPGS